MNAMMCAFVGVSLVIFLLIRSSYGYASYQSFDLEDRCNRSLTIDCPYMYSGRAGTFRYYVVTKLQPGTCYLNVTLDSNCGMSYNYYSIYLNIRKFNLPTNDRVRIYEKNTYSRNLLKDLTGSQSAFSNPASVAQTRTSYVKQPSISFEYFRSASSATGSHEAFIDYVIVEDTSSSHNTYCSALSGYVNDDYICDRDYSTDRVNCPSSFTFDTGRNPAYSRQSCSSSHNNNYYYDDGLSAGAISGIITGCVFFFVIVFYAIAAAVGSRRRAAVRPVVLARGTITTTRPVVVGTYEPMPSYAGAPPSYAEVTATTVTTSQQPPARY
ncbi:uncharacterized protein LOC129596489 [Paramacrobiotus metropolitanus]|uniref:uncharacterized protein LOC129596489 n=1 Tax=Paramacrobiotus metropolitanus TaxID=2943436 RepID=UPI002445C6D8|nr:uncharacterized protein LOC129596489 [Paramacrobiotus metropolitanus]